MITFDVMPSTLWSFEYRKKDQKNHKDMLVEALIVRDGSQSWKQRR